MTVAQEASGAVLGPAVSKTAERLFQEHSGWIYGYCLRFLRSPEEAEDALQATYLNACRSLNAGVRPTVGSAWLLRIAQNVCLTRLRSSGRRDRLEHVQDVTILEETVPAPDRPADDLIGLTAALASLPDQQRHAILLREWQGLSHREVAHRLGLTQGAAETLIFRARRSLAAALENPGARGRRSGAPRARPRRAHHGDQGVPRRERRREDRRRGHRRGRHDHDGRGHRPGRRLACPGPTPSGRQRRRRSCARSHHSACGLERLHSGSADAAVRAGPSARGVFSRRACHGRGGTSARRPQPQPSPRRRGTGTASPSDGKKAAAAPKATKAQGPQRTAGRPSHPARGARLLMPRRTGSRKTERHARLPLSLASTWPGSLGCAT